MLGSGRRQRGRHFLIGEHRRARRQIAAWVVLTLLASTVIAIVTPTAAHAATPGFVQTTAREVGSGTTNAVTFNQPNTAGNLIVAYVVWDNSGTVNVTDTRGNTYTPVSARVPWSGGASAQVFYAKNVAGGTNTVTATFGTALSRYGVFYIAEYSGIDKTNPFDVTTTGTGTTSSAMSSGTATTTNANDLLVGLGASHRNVTGAGAGYTSRSTFAGNIVEDRTVTATGAYTTTATQNGNGWVMQLVAFHADGGGPPPPPDTIPPSVPTGVTANAVSSTQVNLTWNASTDNNAVTGYRVYRNGQPLTPSATTTTTSYQDTTVTASTTYTYEITALDATNESGKSTPPTSVTTPTPPPPPPRFVQTTAREVGSGTTNAVTFNQPNTAGNLIVAYVVWDNSGTVNVTDTRGNTYTPVSARVPWSGGASAQVFYAKNVAGGTNTVTATFGTALSRYGVFYIAEYSGIDKTNPFDVTTTGTGTTSSAMSSGTATTTNANDLLVGLGASHSNVTGAGAGYTSRSTFAGNIVEDRTVTATGAYTATATQNGNGWVMQLVAFRADGGGPPPPPDTIPPSVPTGVTANAVSSTQVNLTWNASTDNNAVTGYRVYRNGQPLTPSATTTTTSYQDTTVTASTTYTYEITALDATNESGKSTPPTSVTTPTPPPPPPSNLVAAYAFDESSGTTAADASGHNVTGTLVNGPTWTGGRFGNAVLTSGATDYVDIGNPTALRLTGSMTVSAWINSSAYPGDDAAIVSKRGGPGFQLDTTIDRGPRTIGFKLTGASGADMFRYGATALAPNSWYFITGVYNAAAGTLDVYLNGILDNGPLVGTVQSAQQDSPLNVNIGRRASGGFGHIGRIDNVRIYDGAVSTDQLQADMTASLGTAGGGDLTPPTVSVSSPTAGANVSDIVTVTAAPADDVGVAGVQFLVDNVVTGVEDAQVPYQLQWDTRGYANGAHSLTARARDASGNVGVSSAVTVNVANTSSFQNEILSTAVELPSTMKFLPDGHLLVAELHGTIKVFHPPYTAPDAAPFQVLDVPTNGVAQGILELELDPNFATNHFYYVFYTPRSPNRDRLSRFTYDPATHLPVPNSEVVLWSDVETSSQEHHGGAIMVPGDGKIYFTTGDHDFAPNAQNLSSTEGKLHRINMNGSVPTDNPFYDGTGPNVDTIWAYGLRNPNRAYYDAPTGRMLIADVGWNSYEELNVGVRGANYGWATSEGACSAPCTPPIYTYDHFQNPGRPDAAITGGFVYHGTSFPASYQNSYFFGDYAQHWIKHLYFDANGQVANVLNFEPPNGAPFGPYGDIVKLVEGPDGAVYYLDIGYSDNSGEFGLSKLRRVRYVNTNQPPVALSAADTTTGDVPLTVHFTSAGSADPEGLPVTYAWDFGDGTTSTQANPTHLYTTAGKYTVRLAVSDGVNTTNAIPLTIQAGRSPTATILSPTDGIFFRAGDLINFSGDATDTADGSLPASAYTWQVDFLHNSHEHPGTPITGVKNGTFTIPTTGHDFSGNTRYRITLTVKNSAGLTNTKQVTIWPTKVNLTFSTAPPGLTFNIDGIATTTPFVYDTLVGFTHNINAINQTQGATNYTFGSWTDGGTQQHNITVPATATTYTATYTGQTIVNPTFVQIAAACPQAPQQTVTVSYPAVQSLGNTNVVAVGWNDATSTITSVADSAGNTYQVAAPIARGTGLSQAIYIASNIKAAGAGANTVTVTFSGSVRFADIRVVEYSGLSATNPVDRSSTSAGNSATATSGPVTTTSANELIFGAGMTNGSFSTSTGGFTTRIITTPDADIVGDLAVTATGTYAYTASLGSPDFWLMQTVTLRGG